MAVARQLGGLRAWLVQRLSAAYMALFLPLAVLYLAFHPVQDFATWRQLLGQPLAGVALALFFLALLTHAWVGMRDLLLDYIHAPRLRLVLLVLLWGALVTQGLWLIRILVGAWA